MKESKFNIGDTVFYMEGSTPQKKVIVGITSMIGKINTLAHSLDLEPDKVFYLYHFGAYQDCAENKCYASKDELLTEVFKNL
jgi:hypothetical protein